MKRKRFSEEEIYRRIVVTETTFYRRGQRNGGMEVNEPEHERGHLKRVVADLVLDDQTCEA